MIDLFYNRVEEARDERQVPIFLRDAGKYDKEAAHDYTIHRRLGTLPSVRTLAVFDWLFTAEEIKRIVLFKVTSGPYLTKRTQKEAEDYLSQLDAEKHQRQYQMYRKAKRQMYLARALEIGE